MKNRQLQNEGLHFVTHYDKWFYLQSRHENNFLNHFLLRALGYRHMKKEISTSGLCVVF